MSGEGITKTARTMTSVIQKIATVIGIVMIGIIATIKTTEMTIIAIAPTTARHHRALTLAARETTIDATTIPVAIATTTAAAITATAAVRRAMMTTKAGRSTDARFLGHISFCTASFIREST